MAAEFNRAVARFIATCAYVTAVHDLVTKWRLELVGGYILDLYFNDTLSKYGYTLVRAGRRVLGLNLGMLFVSYSANVALWLCLLPLWWASR